MSVTGHELLQSGRANHLVGRAQAFSLCMNVSSLFWATWNVLIGD